MMLLLLATVCLNVYLYVIIPKGFFPQQDTGRLIGSIQADQNISFQAMQRKLVNIMNIVRQDPAVDQRRRLYGRRPDQLRLHVRVAEAA